MGQKLDPLCVREGLSAGKINSPTINSNADTRMLRSVEAGFTKRVQMRALEHAQERHSYKEKNPGSQEGSEPGRG